MTVFQSLKEDELLGLCIDREARGEPREGRIAVGSVILNRAEWGKSHKAWGIRYGYDIKTVILAPFQFSWTIKNDFDPNYLGAIEIARDYRGALKSKEHGQWLYPCYGLAQGLISREIKPNTSALYYHEKSIMPKWAIGKVPLTTINRHIFYG